MKIDILKNKNILNIILLFIYSLVIDFALFGHIKLRSLFLFLFLLVLSQISRKLFVVITSLFSIIALLFFPVMMVYGPLSRSMVIASFYTHKDETLAFLSMISAKNLFFVLLLLCLSIYVISRKYLKINKRITYAYGVLLLIFFSSSFVKKLVVSDKIRIYTFLNLGPVEFLSNIYTHSDFVMEEDKKIKTMLDKEDTWDIEEVQLKKDIQIVVIGESVRKDFMHAYGFYVNNTPFMSSSNGILFENFYSAAAHTVPSLTRTIVEYDNPNRFYENNIISLARKAGLNTYAFSAQGMVGPWDSPIAAVMRLADYYSFIQYSSENLKREVHSPGNSDMKLLPMVESVLEKKEGKLLIVVHLEGSHPPVCLQTDGQYTTFVASNEISCYVESILRTDKLLEGIYSAVKKTGKTFSMVYFSDHGLRLTEDKTLLHGGVKQSFEIPLFVWTDDAKSLKRIKARRSALDFLPFFAELSGIKTPNLKKDYIFISEDQAPIINIFNYNGDMLEKEDIDDLVDNPFIPEV